MSYYSETHGEVKGSPNPFSPFSQGGQRPRVSS